MNKKFSIVIFSAALFYVPCYAMESKDDIETNTKEFLKYPISYANFRLTRPYGKPLKSNFDSLTTDISNSFFRQPLVDLIATKLKHDLLNHHFQEKTKNIDYKELQLTSLEFQKDTPFLYHGGRYTIAPEIARPYAMWDESIENRRAYIIESSHTKLPEEYINVFLGTNKEKTNFKISFPLSQLGMDNVTDLSIINDENFNNHSFTSRITHCTMSNNHEWLALSIDQANHDLVVLINLRSGKAECFWHFNTRVTALCAGHKSPLFAVCLKNSKIAFMRTDTFEIYSLKAKNRFTPIGAALSPDDKKFIVWSEKMMRMHHLDKTIGTTAKSDLYTYTIPQAIRKILFTPDGKMIIMEMNNGSLILCDGFTGKDLPQYPAIWRCKDVADIDNNPPLLLYSLKNKLLISLDPANHTDKTIYTFAIRDIANGRFLTAYNFYPNNPRAMGLTKDERSVVFLYNDNTASILHLYTDEDMNDINFVENKANIYQLCSLFDLAKQFETQQTNDMYNKNTSLFVKEMRLMKLNYS